MIAHDEWLVLSNYSVLALLPCFLFSLSIIEELPNFFRWLQQLRIGYSCGTFESRPLEDEEPSLWSSLPDEIRLKVAAALPIESTLALGGTCRTMRKLSRRPQLWRDLSFSSSSKHAHKLTDQDLSSLLRSVDAVKQTEHISLRGCTRLRGHGLEPLRFSCALRSIDLRVSGLPRGPNALPMGSGASIDPSTVVPILKSMLPVIDHHDEGQVLESIHIHVRYAKAAWVDDEARRHDEPWRGLLRWLAIVRERRFESAGACCDHCGCPYHPPDFLAGVLSCVRCGKATCNQLSDKGDVCPTAFECVVCRKAMCAKCDAGSSCARCGEVACSACAKEHGACQCTEEEDAAG